MGELYEPYPRLPKNFRQIGERDDIVRVYVEDYVNTYLKRLFPAGGQDLRAGLLLGNTEEHGGLSYVFIDGALEMENVTETGEKVVFTEESWQKAYQAMEEMFPKRTVQGWFLCGAPGCQLSPLNYWKQHSQYFSEKNKLMYLNSGLEGEEALYITSSDGFYKLRGHCIYYERNQMMQDYMVLRKDNRRVESGGSDPVIRDFRRKMEQKKEMVRDQNHTIHFLRGMCGCLAVLTLAGGVAALNSVEKMKDMEAVMASVLPDADAVAGVFSPGGGGNTEAGVMTESERGAAEDPGAGMGIIVEEASGDVFPTAAVEDSGESGQEAAEAASGLVKAESEKESDAAAVTDGSLSTSAEETGESKASGPSDASEDRLASLQPDSSGETESFGQSAEAVSGRASGRQLEPEPGQSVYVVQEGDTLYGICFKLYQNLSRVDEICRINGLDDVNMLEAGRRLIVP